MKILIIEDDPGAAHFLVKGFREKRWATDVCGDGRDALAMAEDDRYHCA